MRVNNIILIIIVLISAVLMTGCQEVENIIDIALEEEPSVPVVPASPNNNQVVTINNSQIVSPNSSSFGPEFKIGSFNAQVFGPTKAEDSSSLYIFSHIIDSYDIIAFQEIRDATYTAFPKLMAQTPHLKYVVSSRMGKTKSKEQYAYIYDPTKVQLISSSEYKDEEGIFERPPYIASFKIDGNEYVFVQIHVKPDNAEIEIAALEDVIQSLRLQYPGEEDIILLGDLNADCSYYDNNDLTDYHWIITDDMDTTTKSTDCAYDRIIVSSEVSSNIKYAGVDRFDLIYTLNSTETQEISDHYPVYAILQEVKNG